MLTKRLFILICCALTACLLITGLTIFASKTNGNLNHFVRKLPSHIFYGERPLKLGSAAFYFAGTTEGTIFLGSYEDRGKIFTVDTGGRRLTAALINFGKELTVYQSSFLAEENHHLYLFDGLAGKVWQNDNNTAIMKQVVSGKDFNRAIVMDDSVFIFRSIKSNSLVLKRYCNGKEETNTSLLEKAGDGLFSPDGTLLKIPGSNKLIYVYFYRNQFTCFGSDMKLIYKAKTIDTVAHPRIKTVFIQSKGQYTLAEPPLMVNKRCAANDKYLFIQSALRADNETQKTHEETAAIDIYSIDNGKYLCSLYLPNQLAGEKLRDLSAAGNHLAALYGQYLWQFHLNRREIK